VNQLQFTLALILGALGAALCAALIWLPFRSAIRGFLGTKDFLKFRRSLQRLRRFDELIEMERWTEAVRELERSVVYDALSSRQLIFSIKEHHQNLLSRALQVSEHFSARAESVGTAERLFLERAELQVLYLKANETFRRIQDRRTEAGKDLPKWSQADYLKRIGEVNSQLLLNRQALEQTLTKLMQEIQTPRRDDIVYH